MKHTKELKQLYQTVKEISPSTAYRIGMNSNDPEERRFFCFVGDMNLQRRQQKVIEQKLF